MVDVTSFAVGMDVLFRAKTLDNREWVMGFYVNRNNIEHSIYIPKGPDKIEIIPVNHGTLGQFTGKLSTVGNRRIFSDDIVETRTKHGELIRGVVEYKADLGAYYVKGYTFAELTDMIVIGNIFDNRELMDII